MNTKQSNKVRKEKVKKKKKLKEGIKRFTVSGRRANM